MSQELIKKAVMSAAVEALGAFNAAAIAWPSRKFTPPATSWLRVSYMPTKSTIATMGIGGENELISILQIDVSVPTNAGDSGQDSILSELEAVLIPGKAFTYSGKTVTVISCDRSNGRAVDGFWRVSLSTGFRGRYFRPNFLAIPYAYRDENGLIYLAEQTPMTHAEILLLTTKAYPRLIKASDTLLYYAIAANALGSTATEFNQAGGFTVNSENELEITNGGDTLWAPLNVR